MNFLITRAETIAITGIKRTATFSLQNAGELRVVSRHAQQSWFSLEEVLDCVARIHCQFPPDAIALEMCLQSIVEARLDRQKK